jgi:hypothetical protein
MKTRCLLHILGLPLLALGVAAGHAQSVVESPTVRSLASPAPVGSAEPNLATAADGSVYLSWLEPAAGGAHALRFARLESTDGAWSVPRTVTERADLFVNWADFPSLLPARDGRLHAHWLQKNGSGDYAYEVRIAHSGDRGQSWSASQVLHDDRVAGEHGFVSLLESPQGEVQAVWLDGRATGESHAHGHGAMQLGFTTLGADGAPGATTLLDTRTCDCCQTSAAWTSAGPVVVYRDRDANELRDTSIVRRVDGAWTAPATVHADGWRIEGCPVNGPAVAADGARVAVAWYTGAGDAGRVSVAFSEDAGAHFGAPVLVDAEDPPGRVDVLLDAAGRAWVSWLANAADAGGAEVRLRAVAADGTAGAPIVVARTQGARRSGFPRMAMSGQHIVLAWTDAAQPSTVKLARVGVPE